MDDTDKCLQVQSTIKRMLLLSLLLEVGGRPISFKECPTYGNTQGEEVPTTEIIQGSERSSYSLKECLAYGYLQDATTEAQGRSNSFNRSACSSQPSQIICALFTQLQILYKCIGGG